MGLIGYQGNKVSCFINWELLIASGQAPFEIVKTIILYQWSIKPYYLSNRSNLNNPTLLPIRQRTPSAE